MIKPLNFTCKEKLPYLLKLKKGDKFQTIRKAWKKEKYHDLPYDGEGYSEGQIDNYTKTELVDKPPTYKVGDTVPMIWDRDSKNTKLGKIKITDIDLIEISKDEKGFWITSPDGSLFMPGYYGYEKNVKCLALADGFDSVEKFFKYFDDNYDISTPKKFWVYRGEVL